MAIYHTRVKTFSRAKGHSAVAAAAYRAGLSLVDERTGARHDYSQRRSGREPLGGAFEGARLVARRRKAMASGRGGREAKGRNRGPRV